MKLNQQIYLTICCLNFAGCGPTATDMFQVSFSDLKLESIQPIQQHPDNALEHLPERLRQLDGKRIRISGFMYPSSKQTDLAAFLLIPQLQITNFGAPIRVDEAIGVHLRQDMTTDYQGNREFDVEGIFQVAPLVDDEELYCLYQLKEAVLIID